VTNVESLVFSGNNTLSANLPFTSFDLSAVAGQNVLEFATGYTAASAVTLGAAGDTVTNTAGIALTVNATMANIVDSDAGGADVAATITGGTGVDTLNITVSAHGNGAGTYGTGTGLDLSWGIASGSSINVINILDGTGAGYDAYITLNSGYGVSVTVDASSLDYATGTGAETLWLDASGLASAKTANVTGGLSADTIVGGSGNDTIIGLGGDDSITAGVGYDSITAGDGNDTVVMADNLTGDDYIFGGDGVDTISITQTTNAYGDLTFLQISSIETLALGTGAGVITLDTRAEAAGIRTVTGLGSENAVTAAGFTSAVTFDMQGGATGASITGGRGDDIFKVDGNGEVLATTTFAGGVGTDTISIDNGTGNGDATSVTLSTGISSIESVLINDTSTGNTSGDVTITLSAAFGGTSQASLTVDASALDSGETLTFTNSSTADVSSVTGTQYLALTVTGGAGADSLTGGAAAETFIGGSGADTMTGGSGADTLTGGAGADVFIYTFGATGETSSTALDTITDFTTASDKLQINLTYSATGTYDLNYKGAAATNYDGITLLSSTKGQYLLNTATNQFIIDNDGNGLIQSTDSYIKLSDVTTISESDVSWVITDDGNTVQTITLGDGTDTITFEDDGGTGSYGADTYNDFNAGSGGDLLDFDAFTLGTGAVFGTYTLGGTGAAFAVTADNFVLGYGTGFSSSLIGTGAGLLNFATGNVDHIVLVASGTGDTSIEIYFANAAANGTGDAWHAADVKLLGTINLVSGDTASSFNATNFDLL